MFWWAEKEYNITAKVLKALNERYSGGAKSK